MSILNSRSDGQVDQTPMGSETEFHFSSLNRSIKTSGIFERISIPVKNQTGHHSFFKSVRSAFERAKKNGITNPIMVGAIPFDLSQPPSLYIPQQSQQLDRTSSQDSLVSNHKISLITRRHFPEESRYKQSVQQAIANFKLSNIRKAVVSRVIELELDERLPAQDIFNSLKQQNATGYHFKVPLADGGQLMGVSPELLVRKQGHAILSNPLAGSAKRLSDVQQDQLISKNLIKSSKDLYEHRLVIDEIERTLTPLCSELDVPKLPSLLNTSTMWHLSTVIEGYLKDPKISVLEVACQLHPTPAVCGYPRDQAHKLINLVESFERGLFAGMVGWCDSEGNGEWVVTIRCGIVLENKISLFAGAGIVEGSCPDSEWAETQAKLQTMLKAMPFATEAVS